MTPAQLAELGISMPPTQYELPYDDGESMETQRHKVQMDLLIDTTEVWLAGRDDGYTSGNMFVYYSLSQLNIQDFKGPDFFVALGVPKGERLSWVRWEEGKTPDVVIELLSPSTRAYDKGEKRDIYQNQLHIPEYFWFDPFNPDELAGFQLQGGRYQPLQLNEQGQLVSQSLQLALGRWQGTYKGVTTQWLRWTELDGRLLPTAEEQARQQAQQAQQQAEQAQQQTEQAQQRAEQARQQAEQSQQRAEKLAAHLRSLGIDPDAL
ncbi:MAG: Uma2 family endonuclease [Leptolyngbyaceae cyanobacterium]